MHRLRAHAPLGRLALIFVIVAGASVAPGCSAGSSGPDRGAEWHDDGPKQDDGAKHDGGAQIDDTDNPPQFIVANVVDPAKVYMVSKFRSGIGHDYSVGTDETCRSMKHYLSVLDPDAPDYKIENGGSKEAMPAPEPGVDVPIFSPVDGTFHVVEGDGVPINREVQVVPSAYPSVVVRLMHVAPLASLADGDAVKAGQQVGLVLRNQAFDVAIDAKSVDVVDATRYISMFKAMDDATFAAWQRRGATDRDQFFLSRAEVDANPWKCEPSAAGKKQGDALFAVDYMQGEWFDRNEVTLDGYDEVTARIKAKYGR